MDHDDDKKHWDDVNDRCYSSSHSDDSPIISYRYDKRRYVPYTSPAPLEERERRSTLSVLGKFCLFCAAMILFCVLMYIPVYNKANYHIPKGIVAGWSMHVNRDTKIYVQPNNVTTIHEPKDVCQDSKQNKLLLLIIVCSSTENFEKRKAIRETWGSFENYKKSLKVFNAVREKYKNYDFKSDLYPKSTELKHNASANENLTYNYTNRSKRHRRDISSFKELLPVLAKALTDMNLSKTELVPEKRFEEEDVGLLPEFDMNKELGEQTDPINYDYDYESNIMRIPPKNDLDTEETPDLNKIVNLLKQSKDFEQIKEDMAEDSNIEEEFKLVFLLGLPANNKTMEKMIDVEVNEYEDIIQEGFIDSYNNLTLKSIMMLKWVTNKCNNSVRYILKTDDDMYINVPNLLLNLRNRSQEFDKKVAEGYASKEYLLIGDLIINARPVLNVHSKWYSPRYMFNGRVYPRYLSGTGYAMSTPTAQALYDAALRTHYFHLEDIYITGMCSIRARPRIVPRDDPLFSYVAVRSSAAAVCCAHAQITAHRVKPADMRILHKQLLIVSEADRCERIRLTQVRQERLRRLKQQPKKNLNHTIVKTNN